MTISLLAPFLAPEILFKALAGFGAALVLVGLWAAWRLVRPARPFQPFQPSKPVPSAPPVSGAPRPSPAPAARQPPAMRTVAGDPSRALPAAPFAKGPAPASQASLVYLVARHDKVIQSPIAGVYITLGKCFQDLGFQVVRAPALADLEILLKGGVPAVMGIDCRLSPRVLREIAKLARRHPTLRETVFLFYNAERPETLDPPTALPHAHFLGLGITSQQVMEILAPAFEFEPEGAGSGGRTSGAIFEGTVSENSLPEILQFLEVGRRTGLLSIEDEHPVGVINFEGGEIASAQTHLREGVDAIFEILSLGRGMFRFFPGKASGRAGVRYSATQVLMHWAQRMDETGETVAGRGLDDALPD